MTLIRLILAMVLACLAATPALAGKRIALTFDDIPRARGAFLSPDERSRMLVAGLREAGVRQAAFFINPGYLSKPDGAGGEARIASYVAAGHVIANHSFSHLHLANSDTQVFIADIDRADAWLKGRPGTRSWFRFPYLNEGGTDLAKRDAVRAWLAARGLRNGQVTADGSDWFLEDLTLKAKAAGQQMDMEQLRRLYIQMHVSGAESSEALARKMLGRSPAHVMLMHETDLAAMFLPDMVRELRRNGWEIVTADTAYGDPLYRVLPQATNAYGTLINQLARERGVDSPPWPLWIHPGIAEHMFNHRVIKETAAP